MTENSGLKFGNSECAIENGVSAPSSFRRLALARPAALIAFVFLEDSDDEAALEFAHGFRIENVAAIHLQHQCFELVLHGISRFLGSMTVRAAATLAAHAPAFGPGAGNPVPGRTAGAIRRARPISPRAPPPGNKAPATTALTNANLE